MKSSLLFLTLLTLLLLANPSSSSSSSSSDNEELFESWCKQHGKSYSSEQERLYRLGVFKENLAFITQHNDFGDSSYTLSLNSFADLTRHEFKASRLGLRSPDTSRSLGQKKNPDAKPSAVLDVPSEIDWRKKGAVTDVKDQGSCGACWAFSAIGAIEGINKIVTGSLVSLSEQELIDCDRVEPNNGCNGGGLMDKAYQFVVDNMGIYTDEDYPYIGADCTCNTPRLGRHIVAIDGYTDVLADNEEELLKAVATQPVSVGIDASGREFQFYWQGIFSGPCSTRLNHVVLIVGYGSENGVDYWIAKNSWGYHWGSHGYIHILRDHRNPKGVCGINMMASYPTKTGGNPLFPPPAPPPGPISCDLFTKCNPWQTCCCAHQIFGICFSWKCCDFFASTCGLHDYPVFDDTQMNYCPRLMET